MPLFGNGKDTGPVQEPGKQGAQRKDQARHRADEHPAGWRGGAAGNQDPSKRGLGNKAGYRDR